MLAGVIFLTGHHLIAGSVVYQHAGLSTINEAVINEKVTTIQSVNHKLMQAPIKTLKTSL